MALSQYVAINFLTKFDKKGLERATKELKGLAGVKIPTPGGGSVLDFILRNAAVISSYYSAGKKAAGAARANRPAADTPAEGRILAQQRRQEARNIKEINRLRSQEIAKLKEKTAVDQLKDKFDIERIGLTKALNEATDEEVKLRLRAQLAILDNNEALAKKLLAEMEAAEAAKKLALALGSVGDATIEYFKKLAESLVGTIAYFNMSMQQILAERLKESGKTSLGGGMTGGGFTPLTAGYFQNLGNQLQGSSAYAGMSAGEISLERARESGNRSLDVNVRIDSPSGDKFAQLVAESIQVAGRTGFSTTGAGQLP